MRIVAFALLLVGVGGAASVDLDAQEQRGKEIFLHTWTKNEPLAPGGDGLGPKYNASSCVACHSQAGAGGGGANHVNVVVVDGAVKHRHGWAPPTPAVMRMIGRPINNAGLDNKLFLDELTRFAPALRHCYQREIARAPSLEGTMKIELQVNPAGRVESAKPTSTTFSNVTLEQCIARRLRQIPFPEFSGDRSAIVTVPFLFKREMVVPAAAAPNVTVERNTPALFGAGLIDAIPDDVIVDAAQTSLAGHPEIRGKVGRTTDGMITRFGWKGDVSNLVTFVSRACSMELGLEVPGSPQPGKRPDGYDLNLDDLESLVAYVRALPKPAEQRTSNVQAEGAELFDSIGCTACHRPALGDVDGIYSDLLLHNMGEQLDDNASVGYYGSPPTAGSDVWRTPPLWGVGDSGPWLHDGRASTLKQAVAAHGGESWKVMQSWWKLSTTERDTVIAFLESLRAPS
jgi:hypothetical protein